MSEYAPSVAIIGAGIIGLSCAWQLAKRGANVTLYEKNWPPCSASWAAAGMLAPTAEAEHHQSWFDLCDSSNRLWPEFARSLTDCTGVDLDFHTGGSMMVARDAAEATGLERMGGVLADLSGSLSPCTIETARQLVPELTPDIQGAALMPDDGWIDPRKVTAALATACRQLNVRIAVQEVQDLSSIRGYDHILVTAGCGLNKLTGLAVEPVKGVMLAYDKADFQLSQVVRAGLEYAVPREAITVFGATVGEVTNPENYLKARAAQLFPSLATATPIDRWTGYRPKIADGMPVMGKIDDEVFVAGGHYRNGILLAPVTAKIMTNMILDGETSELAAAFLPIRFDSAAT